MSAPAITRLAASSRWWWSLVSAVLALVLLLVSGCSANGDVQRTAVSKKSASPPVQNPSRPAQTAPVKPSGPLRVEIWGDSLVQQTADYLRFFFQVSGKVTAVVHGYGGTAICDWLPDIRKELDPARTSAFLPQALVLAFNGDSGTSCMRDLAGHPLLGHALVRKYIEDSASAIDLAARAKVPIYFVTDPLDSVTNLAFINFTQIGQIFEQLPKSHPAGGLVRWIDAATPLEWQGRFTFTLPCQPWETCTGMWPDGTKTVIVRQSDGMHFCPVTQFQAIDGSWYCPAPMPGATRYAMAISGPVLRDFALAGRSP